MQWSLMSPLIANYGDSTSAFEPELQHDPYGAALVLKKTDTSKWAVGKRTSIFRHI